MRAARARLLEAGLGPGGLRAAVALAVLAAVRAAGLVLVAEGLARGIAALADGSDARWTLLLGALGVAARALAGWATPVVAARGAAAARSEARAALAERLIHRSPSERSEATGALRSGEAAQLAANGLDALDDYFGSVIPAVASAVVVPVGLGGWILLRDWPSALVLLLTLPLAPLFLALIGMHTRDRTDAAQAALARLADSLLELARGLPVIVGLGRDREQRDALAAIQRETRARLRETLRTAFLSALAIELVATISVAVVAVLLGVRLVSGDAGLGAALAVLILAPECFAALRDVGTAFHASQDGLAALRRTRELVDAAPAEAPDRPDRPAPRLDLLAGALGSRELIAVAGPSGSGKSTLLEALAFPPSSAGNSGTRHGSESKTALSTAYSPQTPEFLADTVAEEVARHGGDGAALLDRLGLSGVVEAAPAQLSIGEARRLAVGCALLRAGEGAELVLLDEPTAHLDDGSASVVMGEIEALRGRATVVVATHDPRLLAAADRVVRLGGAGAGSPVAEPEGEVARAARASAPEQVVPTLRGLGGVLGIAPGRWAGAAALGLLAAGFALALSAVSGWLIVRAAEQPAIMYLLVAIVGVRFFGLGRGVARYAERLVTHDAVFATVDALRLRLWNALAARGTALRRLLGNQSADLLVARLGQLREELPRAVVPLAVGVLALAGVVVTVALLAPAIAAEVAAGLVTAAALGTVLGTLPTRRAVARRAALRALLARRYAALVGAGPVARANGVADRALRELADAEARLAESDRRVALGAGLGAAALIAGTLGTALAATSLAGERGVPAALAAAVALLALALLDPLAAAASAVRRLPALAVALGGVAPLLAERVEERRGGARLETRPRSLELRGLAARWPDAPAPVFRGLDAEVSAGEWLAVVGPSGAGKSTLLAVLLGGIAPAEGAVLADGIPVADADPAAWRAAVGWCPQEAHVFDSTIRGNLLLARPGGADDAELEAVLRRVGLGPLLAALPLGLATRVGAGGRALSGGQRQRLAVARTLLADSGILLLDEPTAHLDEEGAAALLADLRAATRDRIVVLVTHREADLAPGDRVLRLGAPISAAARR